MIKNCVVLCLVLLLPTITAEERVVYTVRLPDGQQLAVTQQPSDLILSSHEEITLRFAFEKKVKRLGTERWISSPRDITAYTVVLDGVPWEFDPASIWVDIELEKGEHSLHLEDKEGNTVISSERTIKIVERRTSIPSFGITLLYFLLGLFIVYRRKIKK